MTNENCFLKIVCGTSLLLISTAVLANSSQATSDSITGDNSKVVQTTPPLQLTQLSPNKSDAVASTQSDNNKDTLRDDTTEEGQNKLREEVPMMMPATPTAPAIPQQSNRLNLNNTPPENSQQRLLNPGRPMDSGY